MLNAIFSHGRLAADPELKSTSGGVPYCNFTVAVDGFAKKGEEKPVDFFPCLAWRNTAEMICKYFRKGKEIVISGEMHSSRYADSDGNNRTSWKVTVNSVDFCGSAKETEANGYISGSVTPESVPGDVGKGKDGFAGMEELSINDDNLPF